MADKKDYLEGYEQGLKRGKEDPIMGNINKTLDMALGNPHESARRGLEQGYAEMRAAKKSEKKYAKGGKVAQLAKANGCITKGKTKGRIV
jgi:hypothetical protein